MQIECSEEFDVTVTVNGTEIESEEDMEPLVLALLEAVEDCDGWVEVQNDDAQQIPGGKDSHDVEKVTRFFGIITHYPRPPYIPRVIGASSTYDLS